MRQPIRLLYASALAASIALATAVTGATAANAASAAPLFTCAGAFGCPYFSANGVNIRSAPVNGRVVGSGYKGQKFSIDETFCSGNVGGDKWWDYGTDQSTGVTGWAADYYVSHFAQNTDGPCP
jgi:hypothetical protein